MFGEVLGIGTVILETTVLAHDLVILTLPLGEAPVLGNGDL